MTNTGHLFLFDKNQQQAKLKESESNIRTLQQQLSDIKRERQDREAKIDATIATQAKKKIVKNKNDKGKKNDMADSTSTVSDNNGNLPSS
jgi:multidrug resistance efflux pump